MKTRVENSIDPLGQDPTKDKIESSRSSQLSRIFCCRSTGRSTVNGQIFDHWDPKQRVKLSVGRPGRSTGTNKEHCSCFRSTGRSTKVHVCTLVHVGRPTERFCSASGRPHGRPAEGQNRFLDLFEVNIFLTNFLLISKYKIEF